MRETTNMAIRLTLVLFVMIFAFGAAGCRHHHHQGGYSRYEAPHYSKGAYNNQHKVPPLRHTRY